MKDQHILNVREMRITDISLIADYWFLSDPDFLVRMGVDLKKMPVRKDFEEMLEQQINTRMEEKAAYALIWEAGNLPVGHSNINNIIFGNVANMHLHLWKPEFRRKGIGTTLVRKSLSSYFNNFHLKQLICEPRAINLAPNKTLEKAGFTFEKTYLTIPGKINFEQEVNRWVLTKLQFENNINSINQL